MATPVVEIKTPFSPLTEKQWRVIWLKKLDKSFNAEGVSENQAALHRSIVEAFLLTTEIYTHVSNKEISKLRSPLSTLNLKEGTT